MTIIMKIGQVTDIIPQQVQQTLNGMSVVGAWATFAGLIQDWAGAVAAILSVVWLGLQIWSWIEKRRK